jgi:antibiotic biosynthesis monooxygenase (ABM) superfamily enzyme
VLRLIFAFVDIMLHRRGPDSLPSSKFLFWVLLPVSILGDFFVLWLVGSSGREFAVSLLVAGFDVWFVWALLRTFNRQPRFRQTMIALLGASVIINIIRTPIVPLLTGADPQNRPTIPSLVAIFTIIWAMDIMAFVFSRALERPYLLCVAIVIGYVLLMESLRVTLLQPVT